MVPPLPDRYRVQRKLGEGGMAEVFLVHDTLEDVPRALKLLKPSETSRDYFMHEFRVLARLDHPNLVRVFDFGSTTSPEDGERCFYTCEYLEGQDLFAMTREMDFDGLYDVVRQVLEGLGYIHDRGLVHYDVKPENVNVRVLPATRPGMRARYEVKLVDFGLTGAAHTDRGAKIKGTVHYVAPEVAKSLPADRRADLYSLGITLYYVVTRRLPYDGGSAISIIRKHLEAIPEPPTSLRADVPEGWARFIQRLIEKDPARRYASAPDALNALARRLGRPEAMATAKVRRPQGASGALSPSFVGREPELARLAAAIPGAGGEDAARVFWIEGDEGVGKTRLLYELKVRAQLAGVPFFDSVCLRGGERPFERILRLALAQPELRPLAEEQREHLEGLFPGILGAGEAASAEATGLDELRLRLDRVGEFLLQAARLRPYVLVLEDVRRANEVTVALLGVLLRSLAGQRRAAPPLLVVLTDRPGGESGEVTALAEGIPEELAGEIVEDLSELRAQLAQSGLLEAMPLTRLDLAATSALVASMLALSEAPEALCRKVQEVTGGNPFFVQELIRSLVEDGVLAPRLSELPADLDQVAAPRSLGELLGQRLARLPAGTRGVLVALAVLDAPSPFRLVAHTADCTAEACLEALDVLGRRQMVARLEDPAGGSPRYGLGHAQVQRVVLRSVSRRAQAAAHRRALAGLEALHPEGPARDAVLARLAEHAHRGEDQGAALRYARAAGLRAQAEGNPQLAIELLDRALELLRWEEVVEEPAEREAQERAVLTSLSEVLATVGRYKDATRALEEMLGLGEGPPGLPAAIGTRRRLGDLALRQGNAAEARRWLSDALQLAKDARAAPVRAERARVLEVLSRIALWRGDYLRVIALAGEAVGIFRSLRREADALWALNILCATEFYRGRTARAAEHLRDSLRLARGEASDFRVQLARHGFSDEEQRRFDPELRVVEEADELRRQAGGAYGLILSFTVLGTGFDLCAPLERTIAFYEALLAAYQRRGDAHRTALAHNNLGVFLRQQGQLGEAFAHFERSLAIHEGTSDRQGACVALTNLALLRLSLGDAEGALQRARRALATARELGLVWLTGHHHRVIGRVQALAGSYPEADRELQRAGGVFRMVGNPRSMGDLLLDRAEVALLSREDEEAAAVLQRARSLDLGEGPTDFRARMRLIAGRLKQAQEPSRAVDDLEAALRLAERESIAELRLDALRALAEACTHLGTTRLAQQHLDAATALEQAMLGGLPTGLRECFERSPGAQETRRTARRLVERSLEGR